MVLALKELALVRRSQFTFLSLKVLEWVRSEKIGVKTLHPEKSKLSEMACNLYHRPHNLLDLE